MIMRLSFPITRIEARTTIKWRCLVSLMRIRRTSISVNAKWNDDKVWGKSLLSEKDHPSLCLVDEAHFKRQTQVVQRNLPRPNDINLTVLRPANAEASTNEIQKVSRLVLLSICSLNCLFNRLKNWSNRKCSFFFITMPWTIPVRRLRSAAIVKRISPVISTPIPTKNSATMIWPKYSDTFFRHRLSFDRLDCFFSGPSIAGHGNESREEKHGSWRDQCWCLFQSLGWMLLSSSLSAIERTLCASKCRQ